MMHLSEINTWESPTSRQEMIDWWDQKSLSEAKVMVVGAGAVGNETMKNLVLMGLRYLLAVDMDVISTSNLSRAVLFRSEDVGRSKVEVAKEQLQQMAVHPNFEMDIFEGDLVWEIGLGVFQEMDLVLGCVDNIETRLAINRACYAVGTPWIDCGIHSLGVRVNAFDGINSPCYQCAINSKQWETSRKRYSCDYFRREAVEEEKVPTTQIASAVAGALQSQEAVKLLAGKSIPFGQRLYFQGVSNTLENYFLPTHPHCTAHASHFEEVICLSIDHTATVEELFSRISAQISAKDIEGLDLQMEPWKFVRSISCKVCGASKKLMLPNFKIRAEEAFCNKCDTSEASKSEAIPASSLLTSIPISDEKWQRFSLYELGYPDAHIASIRNSDGTVIGVRLKGRAFPW